MIFAEFAPLLFMPVFFRRIGKGRFTRILLEHSFGDVVGKTGDNTLRKFFNGKTDNQGQRVDLIGHFISSIYAPYNESAVSAFITEEAKNTNRVEQLCDAFRAEIKDIDQQNYAEKIAALLGEVYEGVKATYEGHDSRIHEQNQHLEDISKEDTHQLKHIIRQLCFQIDTLRQLGCVYHYEQFIKQLRDEKSANDKKVREYRKEYELFSGLDKELRFLCHKYPGSLFDKVEHYTNSLDEYCFITRYKIKLIDVSDETNSGSDATSNKSVICAECDPDVELYYDALVELARSLDNIS